MKAETAAGRRLKRLAKRYAMAYAEITWIGSRPPEEHQEVKEYFRKCRKKLHDAIDELTSVDLTPRAISER